MRCHQVPGHRLRRHGQRPAHRRVRCRRTLADRRRLNSADGDRCARLGPRRPRLRPPPHPPRPRPRPHQRPPGPNPAPTPRRRDHAGLPHRRLRPGSTAPTTCTGWAQPSSPRSSTSPAIAETTAASSPSSSTVSSPADCPTRQDPPTSTPPDGHPPPGTVTCDGPRTKHDAPATATSRISSSSASSPAPGSPNEEPTTARAAQLGRQPRRRVHTPRWEGWTVAHMAVLGIDQRLTEFQSAMLTGMRPGQRQVFLEHHRPAPQHAAHRQDERVQ